MPAPNTLTSSPPTDLERANRSALLLVFLVVVIDLLGFGIVLPILPRLTKQYLHHVLTGGENSRYAGLIIGLMMASFSAMQFLFAPIWGRISDRVGRRPILLLGLFGSVVFYGLFGYALGLSAETHDEALLALTLMFVSRIGAGIAGATIATAQAVIADTTTPAGRSRGMALIGAAFGIGFTFGPLLGVAALLTNHQSATGYFASGLSLVALLVGVFRLPETLRQDSTAEHRRWLDPRSLRKALLMPTVGVLILTFFLATFAFANFENTLSLFTKRTLQLEERGNYFIFAYIGLVLGVAQGLIYRRLALRVSEITFMRVGVGLMAVGMFGLGALTQLSADTSGASGGLMAGFLVIVALAVTGFAFLTPSAQALISRRSDPTMQGEILGVNQSASALARILGPVSGLWLFTLDATGILPYLFSGGLLAMVLVSTLRLRAEVPSGKV